MQDFLKCFPAYTKGSNYNSNDYFIYKEISIRKSTLYLKINLRKWFEASGTTSLGQNLASFSGIFTTKDIILNQWKAFITKLYIIIHSFQEKFYLFLII